MKQGAGGHAGLLLGQTSFLAIARLSALMLVSALTEGFGLLLLVPMLQALGHGDSNSGAGRWLEAAGLPVSLGALLALFVGLVILRGAANLASILESQRFQIRLVDGLRDRVCSALLHCDWRTISQMRQSDNVSLLISNVDRIGEGVHDLISACATAATLLGVGTAAFAISPAVSLGALVGGAVALLAYRGMSRRAMRLGMQLGEAYSRIFERLTERLAALRVIKSYGREAQAQVEIAESFRSLRGAERAYLRDSGLSRMALEVAAATFVALLVWVAVERWGQGPADILPLVALLGRGLPLLALLQGTWQNWAHSRPAIDEVAALIVRAEAAREPDGSGDDLPPLRQAVVLEKVTVRFAERAAPVLDAVDAVIPARGLTALTGPSGAGKSTLADLAGGLIAPDEGCVRIDGKALGNEWKRAWRRSVAYVQQEPVLFSGSIRDNLLWAEPRASEEQLHKALARASAGFVEALPEGLDTRVGEGGRQLSGGERQRIVLARALLRKPSLLILDEATSALDAKNEAAIAQALDRLRGEMAVLVICHRGELQQLADRVIRLEHGRVASIEDSATIGI